MFVEANQAAGSVSLPVMLGPGYVANDDNQAFGPLALGCPKQHRLGRQLRGRQ
jgi:hypothetical protein